MKTLTRFTLGLYLAGMLAPFAHELLVDGFEEAACERCAALAFSGPAFESRCDGSLPCENPEHHHHHRRHDHAQCPVCQHAPVSGVPSSRGRLVAPLESAGISALPRAEGLRGRRELRLHPARAPPSVS